MAVVSGWCHICVRRCAGVVIIPAAAVVACEVWEKNDKYMVQSQSKWIGNLMSSIGLNAFVCLTFVRSYCRLRWNSCRGSCTGSSPVNYPMTVFVSIPATPHWSIVWPRCRPPSTIHITCTLKRNHHLAFSKNVLHECWGYSPLNCTLIFAVPIP